MKILNMKFENITDAADWQFVAQTDECMPDGNKNFSGFLTKDNGWRARAHIATAWGNPAASREKAVHNCLTDAIRLLGEVELLRLRRDAELERQRHDIAQQNARLRNTPLKIPETTNQPSVCNTVLGLKRNEVKGFVNLMVEACKRDDKRE
jgi:hypothetical protein